MSTIPSSTVASALADAREDVFICPAGTVSMYVNPQSGELKIFAEPDAVQADWDLTQAIVKMAIGDQPLRCTERFEFGGPDEFIVQTLAA
jgi:hypothetical protein